VESFIVFIRLMKLAAIIVCWISVIAAGAWLRFDDLARRPFHADEATGARITAQRMVSGDAKFDPKHFHGPLLADLAIPLCALRGEHGWREMSKTTLRTLPAIAGTLLVLLPLLWRRRFGDLPMLLAAALLATSPLLAYYSRMFIHEMLLTLFGMLALVCLTGKPRLVTAGIMLGLMFATKETFAISVIAWTGAGLLVAMENRRSLNRETLLRAWCAHRLAAGIGLLAAAVTAGLIYTDGLRHPHSAIDAIRTFFVYETVGTHDKAFGYYAGLLAIPVKSAGVWWFGTPVLVLALLVYLSTFRRDFLNRECRIMIHFLAYAAAGHFLIYSMIAYKTPWLVCLPWAHVCVLAGFAIAGFSTCRMPARVILTILAGLCLVTQFIQTRRAIGRYAADARNPFAYVPTQRDVESLESWLGKLRAMEPAGALEPVAIVGSQYWPLPWYLRAFDKIGYWQTPPENLQAMPLVFATPDATESVMAALTSTHQSLPRGLRADVPLLVFVRNDIWHRWQATPSP